MHCSKHIFIYLLCGLVLGTSCTKNFQELNATQNAPSTTTLAPLLNGIESTLFLGATEQGCVFNDYYFPSTQLAASTAFSAFVLSNGVNEIWNGYYTALQNINLALSYSDAVFRQGIHE
jgi:hypothetical protein